MRILLLGGFGFIGTNILKYAEQYRASDEYIIFDRYSSHIDKVKFKNVIKVYSGDFSDKSLLESVFIENKIDLVIHSLSASIPSSANDNVFDLQCNVIPSIVLLGLMAKYQLQNIVFISSGGAIYGDVNTRSTGFREDDALFPKSAYGISKLATEKYLFLYNELYGINSIIVRLSNPYGPYHYSQRQGVVNIALEKAMHGESLEIWGDGNGHKDYIYIVDFCRILFQLIDLKLTGYHVLNVGSGLLLSVNQIVDVIRKNYFSSFSAQYHSVNKLDVCSFKLDLRKLHELIGDFAYTSFDVGLRLTYDWYCSKKSKKI